MKSFTEIGKELGMPPSTVQKHYSRALVKMKVHMRSREEWEELLTLRTDTSRIVDLIMATLTYGAMVEKGMTPTRRDQTAARSAFKMAYRRFLRGEE